VAEIRQKEQIVHCLCDNYGSGGKFMAPWCLRRPSTAAQGRCWAMIGQCSVLADISLNIIIVVYVSVAYVIVAYVDLICRWFFRFVTVYNNVDC